MIKTSSIFARLTAASALLLSGLLSSTLVSSQQLSTLAASADLVAVALVEQVDYQKTRQFPSGGSAFLKILFPYKGEADAGDWIEVKEKGLGDDKCYYPEPDPFRFEGTRFLVLLNRTEKPETYQGMTPGCMIPVLVTDDNRYMVRYPVAGLDLPTDLAEEVTYADPASIVDATDFTSMQVDELVNEYFAELMPTGPFEPNFQRYRYTRGIPLSDVRRLLFPEPN